MTVMERVAQEIASRGIKQKTVCEACGASPSLLSTWLRANPPSIPSEYVPGIAKVFGMTCDELLTGEKPFALSADERRMIDMFRSLPWDGQQIVMATVVQEQRRAEEP